MRLELAKVMHDLDTAERVARSRGTPTCDHLAARIKRIRADLADAFEVDDGQVYIRIGMFDIKIKQEDEGVVVDVYSGVDDTQMEPLATCYAFDVDALPEEAHG